MATTRIQSGMKLNVPEQVYRARLQRMKSMIEMGVPRIIIYNEARLLVKALQPDIWHRFKSWLAGTLWLDIEWWRYKITGKSEIYAPDLVPIPFEIHEEWDDKLRHVSGREWTPEGVQRLMDAIMQPECSVEGGCGCYNADTRRLGCRCLCHD